MPAGDRVRLEIEQRTAPAGPPSSEGDPEQPIQGSEDRSLMLALVRPYLESEGGVLDRHGLVAAHQESEEAEDGQKKGWHMF